MRRHPEAGVELLAGIEFPWDVRPLIESHHERWDGNGYPDALAGNRIPLAARVVAITSVYESLRTKRLHRPALSHNQVVRLLTHESPGEFDPTLITAFVSVARKFDEIFQSGKR